MRCQFCGKRLPILRKLTDGEFCSPAHRRAFTEQQEQQALSRLLEASLGSGSGKKKTLAHPDAEALVVPGGRTVPGRPHAAAPREESPQESVGSPTPPAAAAAPKPAARRPGAPEAPPGCDRFFSTPLLPYAMRRPTSPVEPVYAEFGLQLPDHAHRRTTQPAGFGDGPLFVDDFPPVDCPAARIGGGGGPSDLLAITAVSPMVPERHSRRLPAETAWRLARPSRMSVAMADFRERFFKVSTRPAPWEPLPLSRLTSGLHPEMDWAPSGVATGTTAAAYGIRPRQSEPGLKRVPPTSLAAALAPAPRRQALDLAKPNWPSRVDVVPGGFTGRSAVATEVLSRWDPSPLTEFGRPAMVPGSARVPVQSPLSPRPAGRVVSSEQGARQGVALATLPPASPILDGEASGFAISRGGGRSGIRRLPVGRLTAPPAPVSVPQGVALAPLVLEPVPLVPRVAFRRTHGQGAGLRLRVSARLVPYRPSLSPLLARSLASWRQGPIRFGTRMSMPALRLVTESSLAGIPPLAGRIVPAANAGLKPAGIRWTATLDVMPLVSTAGPLSCRLRLRGAAPPPASRLVRLPFLWTTVDGAELAGGSDQPMVYVRPVPPRTALRPEPARFHKQGRAQDALRQLPATLAVPAARRFWRLAPADLRWVALVIPVVLLIGWYSLAPKKRLSDEPLPEVPSAGAAATEGILDNYLRNLKTNISRRAAIELSDDFRSGLAAWEGDGNWADGWSYDQAGFVRPGAMALLRPSLRLTDYTFEFLGKIDRRALSWVYRSKDTRNYHLGRLIVIQGGPLPQVAFVRSVVKNGKEIKRHQVPLHEQVRLETLYRVRVDVNGNDFTTSVLGKVVDTYTDESHPVGGVGFLAPNGEESRIRWVEVSHQYDTIGRLCAWLAPNELTKPPENNGPEKEKKTK